MNNTDVIQTTKNWINSFVIELNLCPFAKAEIKNNTVRFDVSEAITEEQLLQHLQFELNYLTEHSSTETTLLIHPKVLTKFCDYNNFLELCDDLLCDMQLDGIYQIASFHPNYQFADTELDNAENFSNRSPHPMLHLLREQSLSKAVDKHPDINQIPNHNIKTLNNLGSKKCLALLNNCF